MPKDDGEMAGKMVEKETKGTDVMAGVGKVILVGAGPGNVGLMTLRGKEALQSADVVLYDRLVGPDVLALIPEHVACEDVGKNSGHHAVPQHEINARLLHLAQEGKCVVRLKGGDPYVFGRGAEEAQALAAARIPFEVVPGVTSAIAVPAFAGIPVSHRDASSSVHIITAHRKAAAEGPDYEGLVKLKGTLVFLMGLGTIVETMEGLMAAGMDTATPAALIENGTRPNQRRLVATVADIARRAKEQLFEAPAVLVVGSVCALADELDWFSKRPLYGTRVIVTRPRHEGTLGRRLAELGAEVVGFPCIRTQPLPIADAVFHTVSQYTWVVFTSPTGAELFFEGLMAREVDIRSLAGVRFAAVGAKTAAVVTARGIRVDYVPETAGALELASNLPSDLLKLPGLPEMPSLPELAEIADLPKLPEPTVVPGLSGDVHVPPQVLLFRAKDGTAGVADTLRSRGFEVEDVAAYGTVRAQSCPDGIREMVEDGNIDYVMFTSASTVQGFIGALPGVDCSRLTAVCIGEATAAKARGHGFRILVSEQASIESMAQCVKPRQGI